MKAPILGRQRHLLRGIHPARLRAGKLRVPWTKVQDYWVLGFYGFRLLGLREGLRLRVWRGATSSQSIT